MTDEIDFGDLELSAPYRQMVAELDAGPDELSVLVQDAIEQTYKQLDQQRRAEQVSNE